ncbi:MULTISPECIES: paraquat-inducible protein A [unclassified Rhizobium]|uniref:paraquat-inducible protein A n=1 Tax=unclassified Rhizobium TaxID=2613769 RepID=UPI0007148800|nr:MULTISPECIES: paraquat-inducible protein A [unclassified Rhizobium]KQS84156.1 paraquat-inducible protein A [Rhizobium sp. Leaf386]KQT00781.1 paraquat-inducible protein A [Rhizobium sp. Leaf391]KQU08431.1 paraquat-inducible protein A [Rhizobium sp. Leaf453]
MRLITPVFLVLATFFLALGLVLPLVRFEKLIFFNETPSLLGIVWALWERDNPLLAVIVGLFSIVFPFAKLIAIAFEATVPADDAAASTVVSRLMPILGKWSMMDVMLVALVIFAAKTSGLAEAFTQAGLWFYAGSAILTGLLQMRLRPH